MVVASSDWKWQKTLCENGDRGNNHRTCGSSFSASLDTRWQALFMQKCVGTDGALRLGETVTGFRQAGDSVLTLLEDSAPLYADMVLLAIGVTPDHSFGKRGRTQAWYPGQHRCQRADGNLRAGHLRCGRCRRGHPFRDRPENIDLAGGACQQAGTHCRRQHLRRKQPLSRLSGFVCSEIV